MDDWKLTPARDLALAPMARFRAYGRESGLLSSMLRLGWWSATRAALRLWNRVTIHGREHLPKCPSFVLVANHLSHLDVMVLGSLVPLGWRDALFPLGAQDVFFERLSIAGFAAAVLNALPVRRRGVTGHALEELRERMLLEARIYILFPEGARSRNKVMARFKPGIGMLVAGTAVPVVPCYLQGTFEALPPNSWLPRPRRIEVRIGTPLTFAQCTNERGGWNHVAGTLEDAVRKLAISS